MLGYGYGYGSPFYMFWDPTYVLILIGVVLSLIASAMVRRNFARYSVVRSASGLTGAQVAQRILSYAGINDVTVCHISGNLTDHYNPRTKQIGLSDSVYGSNSVAAIAVAAHECGQSGGLFPRGGTCRTGWKKGIRRVTFQPGSFGWFTKTD